MTQRLFLVDTEATGKTPYSGVMTEFGVVDFTTRDWFHGHLYDATPHPERPALPVLTGDQPNPWVDASDADRLTLQAPGCVFLALGGWLDRYSGRPVFVSDNPAFDWMWIADGFDRAGLANPFGWSGRRIGDLAAGLERNWRNVSAWKRFRRTRHDHNPVNDALGNAEALHAVLARHGQRF